MKFLLLITTIFIMSCATSKNIKTDDKENEKSSDSDESIIIKIPQDGNKNQSSLFFNTQILETKIKNGIKYEFFYGTGGRYVVKVKSLNGNMLPYEQAEMTVTIQDEIDPETISLASTTSGVFSGFGNSKNGRIILHCVFFIPESKNNSLINEKFIIETNIKDIN